MIRHDAEDAIATTIELQATKEQDELENRLREGAEKKLALRIPQPELDEKTPQDDFVDQSKPTREIIEKITEEPKNESTKETHAQLQAEVDITRSKHIDDETA